MRRRLGWIVLLLAMGASAGASTLPEDLFDQLEYRHIGPLGNRVIAVTGVPGDGATYYVGAASGGIFKTSDGGATWQPIFDEQPVSSIGALAVAPSDPNIVWAGTGETFLRANVSIGNGIYKSEDGGKTWVHKGLDASGRIGRVIVHPSDPQIVYAAALGHCYGPQQERGVYRTVDGGDTWRRVLFSGENAGASDLVMDPTNPRILFAGMWQMHINTWSRQSGGPESGLWTSRDGGNTWSQLTGNGLPDPPWGKIGLTMSADDPQRVYALIETSSNRDFAPVDDFQGVLWRSDDGGSSWQMVSADNRLVQRPLYYSRALAAPDDADEVHFMSVRHRRSLDGGATSSQGEQAGWDHHDIWIDPQEPDRMIVGHDGGVSISINRGETWLRPQLPIAQMYHVHVDDQIPYYVYGNRQDGPAVRGPSNTLTGSTIPIGAWHSIGGCEVGFAIPTPGDSNIVWTGCYDGILERFDARTGHARDVSVWPLAAESWPAMELEYRFQWTFPVAISPHDPKRVYAGSQFVHVTVDDGQSWQMISPDLTTDDPELQQRTGGLTFDDAGPTLAPTIFALAESRREPGLLWAGTNDGQVQLSRDGGGTWSNVTANLPDLPPRGTISNIEPSPHAAGTAYLTVDRHQLGDTAAYVYRTRDYGATWQSIGGGIPASVLSYAHCVREDPKRQGLLYLGTENGLYVSFSDGARWHSLQSNLPHAPVHWLTVQEHFDDLVVATYGRGFWVLDDITPLQQLADLGEDPILFAPRDAYRFLGREAPMMQPGDPAAGTNPTYGASIHFYLPAVPEEGGTPGDGSAEEGGTSDDGTSDDASDDASAEEGGTSDNASDDGFAEEGGTPGGTSEGGAARARLTVINAAGEVVWVLDDPPSKPGLHRVHWDLDLEQTPKIKLRTPPEESSHVDLGEKGWRDMIDGGRLSVLAPPGTYRVRLEVGDRSWTQPLEVLKDPGSAGSAEDLAAQTEVVLELRRMVSEAAEMINQIEWTRKQIDDLEARLGASPYAERGELAEVLTAANELDGQLRELEGRFFDLRLTHAGQDTLRWKRLLYARLLFLVGRMTTTDQRPTDQQMAVYRLLEDELNGYRRRYRELRDEQVPAFNELLRDRDISQVVLGPSSN